MTELLRSWVLAVTGAAIFCALASELTPEGGAKSVQRLLCGLVMTLAIISPLKGLDFTAYSLNLAEYRQQAEEIAGEAQEISDSLSRTIIEEECRAYILDKAEALGLELGSVEVELRWSGEAWYPVSAELAGEYDRELSEAIETELGIGADAQHWSGE